MIGAEELVKKLEEFKRSIPHGLSFYYNNPSKSWRVVCGRCEFDVRDCPIVMDLKREK